MTKTQATEVKAHWIPTLRQIADAEVGEVGVKTYQVSRRNAEALARRGLVASRFTAGRYAITAAGRAYLAELDAKPAPAGAKPAVLAGHITRAVRRMSDRNLSIKTSVAGGGVVHVSTHNRDGLDGDAIARIVSRVTGETYRCDGRHSLSGDNYGYFGLLNEAAAAERDAMRVEYEAGVRERAIEAGALTADGQVAEGVVAVAAEDLNEQHIGMELCDPTGPAEHGDWRVLRDFGSRAGSRYIHLDLEGWANTDSVGEDEIVYLRPDRSERVEAAALSRYHRGHGPIEIFAPDGWFPYVRSESLAWGRTGVTVMAPAGAWAYTWSDNREIKVRPAVAAPIDPYRTAPAAEESRVIRGCRLHHYVGWQWLTYDNRWETITAAIRKELVGWLIATESSPDWCEPTDYAMIRPTVDPAERLTRNLLDPDCECRVWADSLFDASATDHLIYARYAYAGCPVHRTGPWDAAPSAPSTPVGGGVEEPPSTSAVVSSTVVEGVAAGVADPAGEAAVAAAGQVVVAEVAYLLQGRWRGLEALVVSCPGGGQPDLDEVAARLAAVKAAEWMTDVRVGVQIPGDATRFGYATHRWVDATHVVV